ncbi:class E sortase [Actinokineospora auranticolor]|uniref:LPXTG-site transpeptidase (Sortase) family protein n=1 Tax=Actinokineospora auranticolor TaxID=155976 RepID=A0A2S6GS92_9PSEU|nr:class E sortase [Actinokineospora auranticolor]PPK68118.1 LPXTG-site transpeptidase (sortase) family protein [Actinokineospora auranticolor]
MTTLDTGGHTPDGLVGPEEPPKRADTARTVVRGIGELLITAGLVVLLFVVYEVYVTDIVSAGKQRDATTALDNTWGQPDTVAEPERVERFTDLGEGTGFAKMHIPAFGLDYGFTVIEGTTEKSLEIGPGHYRGTAYPGEPGNFAVAGHRVGKGAPFNDIDLLNSCDAILVETHYSWFVYRVLPKSEEVVGWATGKGTDPRCQGVAPLGGPYEGLVGQQIVRPSQGEVIAPIPGKVGAESSVGERATLMTLTTCHPRFSDRQRLIVHAVMVKQWAKDPAKPGETPPELKETS